MPTINHFVETNRSLIAHAPQNISSEKNLKEIAHQNRIKKLISVQLILAYAYWSVCGLFVLATFFIVWLYMREVTHGYLDVRKQIVLDTIGKPASDLDPDDHNRESDA